MRLHIYKSMQSEAPFYSKFLVQFNCLKFNDPDLAAITRNIHQVSLFRHFLYSQVLPGVSPEMSRLSGRATKLAKPLVPQEPSPPSLSYPSARWVPKVCGLGPFRNRVHPLELPVKSGLPLKVSILLSLSSYPLQLISKPGGGLHQASLGSDQAPGPFLRAFVVRADRLSGPILHDGPRRESGSFAHTSHLLTAHAAPSACSLHPVLHAQHESAKSRQENGQTRGPSAWEGMVPVNPSCPCRVLIPNLWFRAGRKSICSS